MAASSGFATSTIAQLKKMDIIHSTPPLIHSNSSSFSSSSSSSSYLPFRIVQKPLRIKPMVVDRGSLCLNPRCEVASVRGNEIRSKESSLSALELLKTSAGDSESHQFTCFFYFFSVLLCY